MVAMHLSNKSKHPGKVDLPAKRQKDAEDSDDKDNEDNVKKCQPVRKKPAPRRHQQAKKAAATKAIAQLELEMKEKDAQDLLQANRPPTLNVSKVPRKLSISVLGDPADETIVEDVMLIDNDQNNESRSQNSENLPGSYKPGAKFTKAQKVHRNVEAAKQRAAEQPKGRAESKEDEEAMDSGGDNVRGVGKKQQKGSHTCSDGETAALKSALAASGTGSLASGNNIHPGGFEVELDDDEQPEQPGPNQGEQDPLLTRVEVIKAAQATSTATSTRPTPNEPLSHSPSNTLPSPPSSKAPPSRPASKAPPSHPPSKAPILNHTFGEPQFSHAHDEQTGTGGREQAGGGSGETDMREGEDMHYSGEQGSSPEPERARPYMWKLKVVGHTITRPPPKCQGSATNSMQIDRLKTGYGKSNECCNNRATGQQGKNNATSRKSVTNAPRSTRNNSEDDDNNDSSGDNESSQAPRTHVKFTKNNLPPGSPCDFDALVVPMWIDFISTLDNMWDISDFADKMQRIWDLALPAIKHTVSKSKDPAVVTTLTMQLMQQAYDYCSNFGERAKIVIAQYIEEQGWMSDKIQQVVAYIVPKQIPLVNKKGQTVLNYYGAFEDQCILDTFALYLEHVHCLPTTYHSGKMLKGALSIATVAVEQMWNMWKTGHFVQPTKAS
ncbi:hypothetical protein BDR06DRAFT_1009099 [Suillus hirtellus]|nr:hypothetical protein BDR06DRAFT_1009099 [Suillus hirtellus]